MKTVWIAPAVFLLLGVPIARAQTLERSVVSPSGSSGVAGNARIAWTSGQIETHHFQNGGTNITLGFQQPEFTTAHLLSESFSGNAGERREARIILTETRGLLGASALRVRLRFNATLLEPIATTPGSIILHDTIENGERTLALQLPIQPLAPSHHVLATIRFKVGLGNDSITTLDLIDAAPLDGQVRFTTSSGRFTLLGICREGAPRLVDPIRRASIALRPNPVVDLVEIDFRMMNDGHVHIALIDLLGNEIRTLVDKPLDAGEYSVGSDVGTVPAGAYSIVMTTGSTRIVRPVVIKH